MDVTLNISDQIIRRAKDVASKTHRSLEDVLLDWLSHSAEHLPIASLSDNEVLALCDLQMDQSQNDQMSALLHLNAEGALSAEQKKQLDHLIQVYRTRMLRKSEALKVAVQRGVKLMD